MTQTTDADCISSEYASLIKLFIYIWKIHHRYASLTTSADLHCKCLSEIKIISNVNIYLEYTTK